MKNVVYALSILGLLGCQSTPERASSVESSSMSKTSSYESRCKHNELNDGGATNNLATPIVRVEPRYPISAARNGISGHVVMEFDISEQGTPVNINIIESNPKAVFDMEAKNALQKWRYKPAIKNGKAVTSKCLSITLTFKLG